MSELEEKYQRIKKLREECGAKGKWQFWSTMEEAGVGSDNGPVIRWNYDQDQYPGGNGEFIAAAPDMFALLTEYRDENARLREALGDFLGLSATCNQINQPEWMEYFVEKINECCELLGADLSGSN